MLVSVFGEERMEKVHSLYPDAQAANGNAGAIKASRIMQGDNLFAAPSEMLAAHAANAHARGLTSHPTYMYCFDRQPDGEAGEMLGAYHAAEIDFVFADPQLMKVRAGAGNASHSMRWVQHSVLAVRHSAFVMRCDVVATSKSSADRFARRVPNSPKRRPRLITWNEPPVLLLC